MLAVGHLFQAIWIDAVFEWAIAFMVQMHFGTEITVPFNPRVAVGRYVLTPPDTKEAVAAISYRALPQPMSVWSLLYFRPEPL